MTTPTTNTPATTTFGWHFTAGGGLRDGQPVPPVGEWLAHEGTVEICKAGLHFAERVTEALRYAPGATLHRVEVRGVVENDPLDKGVARERKIVQTCHAKEMLPLLVRFSWACAWRAAEHAAATLGEMSRAFGERVASRLRQGRVVIFPPGDRRGDPAKDCGHGVKALFDNTQWGARQPFRWPEPVRDGKAAACGD